MEVPVTSQKPPSRRRGKFLPDRNATRMFIKIEAWSSPRSWRLENPAKVIISSNKQQDTYLQLSGWQCLWLHHLICFPESLNSTWIPFLILPMFSDLAPFTDWPYLITYYAYRKINQLNNLHFKEHQRSELLDVNKESENNIPFLYVSRAFWTYENIVQ